jgi:putative phosphoesterase
MNHPNALIGVLSDTHGLLRPELLSALANVDHILHAGDIGDPDILTTLSNIAPVTAIRGNIDTHGPCSTLPATEAIELSGCLIYIVHNLDDLDLNPQAAGIGVVLYGHSHKPSIGHRNGVLYLNPGSAGPRRFNLPIAYSLLRIANGQPQAEILPLELP